MPFCSTRRPTVMTVGPAKAKVSLEGADARGLGRKASLPLGTKALKRVERALAVRGHHVGPPVHETPQELRAETLGLQAGVVALGNHGVCIEPARRENGREYWSG